MAPGIPPNLEDFYDSARWTFGGKLPPKFQKWRFLGVIFPIPQADKWDYNDRTTAAFWSAVIWDYESNYPAEERKKWKKEGSNNIMLNDIYKGVCDSQCADPSNLDPGLKVARISACFAKHMFKKVLEEYPQWDFFENPKTDDNSWMLNDLQDVVNRKAVVLASRMGRSWQQQQSPTTRAIKQLVQELVPIQRELPEQIDYNSLWYLNMKLDEADRVRALRDVNRQEGQLIPELMMMLKNIYARLFKLDSAVDPNLPRIDDWEIEQGFNNVLLNVTKIVRIFNKVHDFVKEAIEYVDIHLTRDIRGDFCPEVGSAITVRVDDSNCEQILRNMPGKIEHIREALGALETALIFEKRRSLSDDLSVERIYEDMKQLVMRAGTIRQQFMEKGIRVPPIRTLSPLTPQRAFGWVTPMVSFLVDNWHVINASLGMLSAVAPRVLPTFKPKELPVVDENISVDEAKILLPKAMMEASDLLNELEGRRHRGITPGEFIGDNQSSLTEGLRGHFATQENEFTVEPDATVVREGKDLKRWHRIQLWGENLVKGEFDTGGKLCWQYYVPKLPESVYDVTTPERDWRWLWFQRTWYAFYLIERMWLNFEKNPSITSLNHKIDQVERLVKVDHERRLSWMEKALGPPSEDDDDLSGRTFPILAVFPTINKIQQKIEVLETKVSSISVMEFRHIMNRTTTTVHELANRLASLEAGHSQSSVSNAAFNQVTNQLSDLAQWRIELISQMGTYVKSERLTQIVEQLTRLQTVVNTIKVPQNLEEQLQTLKARIDQVVSSSTGLSPSYVAHIDKTFDELRESIENVKTQNSLSVAEKQLLVRLTREYPHLVAKVSNLQQIINDWGTKKAFGDFEPIVSIGQNQIFTGKLEYDMLLALSKSVYEACGCLEWYMSKLQGRERVLCSKWLQDLRSGKDCSGVNIIMLDSLKQVNLEKELEIDALVNDIKNVSVENEEEEAGSEICDAFLQVHGDPEPLPTCVVGVRSGKIPHRKLLAEKLGYNVGKNRMWLSHVEWNQVKDMEEALDWMPFVHPNNNFSSGPDRSIAQNLPVEDNTATVGTASQGDLHSTLDSGINNQDTVDEVYDMQDFDEGMFRNLHPSKCVLTASRSVLGLNIAPGNILMSWRVKDILRARGPFSGMMHTIGLISGALALSFKLNVSPLCGIALMAVYLEAGRKELGSGDIMTYVAHPHRVWNPACEDSMIFPFQPVGCDGRWHPDFFQGHEGIVMVVAASSWLSPPTSNVHFSWNISYMAGNVMEQHISVHGFDQLTYRKNLGTCTFAANEVVPCRKMELPIGKPLASSAGLHYSLWDNLIGMFQYWKADMIFEIIRASSPMVSATLGFAIVPGSRANRCDPEYLQTIPHCEFSFDPGVSTKTIRVPKHFLAWYGSSDRNELKQMNPAGSAFTVVLWILDAPTSSGDRSLSLIVNLSSLKRLETYGHSGGYIPSYKRMRMATFSHVPGAIKMFDALTLGVDAQQMLTYQRFVAPDITQDVVTPPASEIPTMNAQTLTKWNHCFTLPTPSGSSTTSAPYILLDAHRPFSATMNGKTSAGYIVYSPFVRVLQSCQWIKGHLLYRVVWACKPGMPIGEWTGSLRVSVYTDSVLSLRVHHFVSSSRSGEHEFVVNVDGPVEGFSHQEGQYEFHKPHSQILIEMINPEKFEYCEGYVAPDSDVVISGVGSSLLVTPSDGVILADTFTPA